nr:MAG TPA: tail spike protein [Caudoviricetes sp.]
MGSPIYIQLKGDVKLTPEVLKPSVVYQCDGVNKKFIFPYDFMQIEDIKLTIVDVDGTEAVQVGNIDYDESTKSVIYPANGDALAVGQKVILERKTPISQDTDLPDEYPFENIERATDKIVLILQEMKADLDRSLKIRVDSDKNPNEVAKDIVERSVKAANDAMNAMNVISEKSDKINANADIINRLGEEIKAIASTVDDKLATANTALDTSSTNVATAERLVRDAKAYAGQTTVDKRDINELVSQARNLKTDIDNKQTSIASNAIKATDAAKRAETAAAKAEQIALPNGGGLVTKTEADAKYQTKDSLYGIVSVKDFGAVGDGVADDTAAFKRANDNLKNKILLVPNGIYKINEHLTFNTVDSVMDMGTYSNIKPFYPTETPMLKGSSNIAFVKNIQYGDEVNQCQGFTYNDKKNVFVLACISGDGNNQILYELNSSTFEIVGTYKFNDPDKMGHCNTMCYNKYTNKIYLANGLKNGNNLTVLDADTMQYERTITLNERVFNIGYDPITRTYVSIVPISGQQRLREINLYNDDFKKLKTYQVDYEYDDFNNNGAFMLNGCIMSATLGSLVECTPFGTVKQIIEINKTTEIEDIAYYNGKFYFAVLTEKPNKRHQVDIYVGDPNKDYQNSINTARLATLDYLKLTGGTLSGALKMANNTLIEGYKPDGHGVGMAKVSTAGNVELGDNSVNTFVKGVEFKHYDGTDSYTVLTTKHYGTALYKKKDVDDNFVKKSEVDQLGFPYTKVEAAKDWNTFTEQGAIEINFDGGANNPPRSHKQGMLIVMNFGKGAMIDQTFHAFNGETYHRMFMANQWKSWGRVQTSLNSRLKLWSANGGNEVYVE